MSFVSTALRLVVNVIAAERVGRGIVVFHLFGTAVQPQMVPLLLVKTMQSDFGRQILALFLVPVDVVIRLWLQLLALLLLIALWLRLDLLLLYRECLIFWRDFQRLHDRNGVQGMDVDVRNRLIRRMG